MTESTFLVTQVLCTLKAALAVAGIVLTLGVEYYRLARFSINL